MAVSSRTLDRLATFKLRAGNIVLARRGEMGRCAVVRNREDGWLCGTGCLILRLPEGIHSPFLSLLLGSPFVREYLNVSSVGTTMQNLNQAILLNLVIGLPPTAEQHRIVAKVNELMGLCDQLETAREDREQRRSRAAAASLFGVTRATDNVTVRGAAGFYLDEFARFAVGTDQISTLRKAILALATTGRLLPQDCVEGTSSDLLRRISAGKPSLVRAGAIKEPKTEPIGEDDAPSKLPSSWSWVRTEALCEAIVDCPHSTPTFELSGVVCLDTNCFKNGTLLPARVRFVSEETYQERVRRLAPAPGDVVFAREGSVGSSMIVPEGMKCCLGQRVMLFRLMSGVLPEYFSLAISEDSSLTRLLAHHKGIGAKHVNVADMRNALIPLPPTEEQRRIVARVTELMGMCDQLGAYLADSELASGFLLDALVHEATQTGA